LQYATSTVRIYTGARSGSLATYFCWHCGARLAVDRDPYDLCSSCGTLASAPRQDPLFKERVLCFLIREAGKRVLVGQALDADKKVVEEAVAFWRRRGVPIAGVPRHGYVLDEGWQLLSKAET
jgi:hypothetical protein